MDTIGLLAAWVGIFSFLLAIVIAASAHLVAPFWRRWFSKTTPARARNRIQRLYAEIEISQAPDNAYLGDLITLYARMILNLIAAVAVMIVSIEILDLAPALLASTLPFSIDAKILTRGAGLIFLAADYWFVFRLSYLAIRIRNKTAPRRPGYALSALREIAALREAHDLPKHDLPEHDLPENARRI